MKNFEIRKGLAYGTLAALSVFSLSSCSWADINPASSVTHDADKDSGSTKEILLNYPSATNIEVTHAADNPNIMTWNIEENDVVLRCTAIASQTVRNSSTPGEIISEPYCRKTPNN